MTTAAPTHAPLELDRHNRVVDGPRIGDEVTDSQGRRGIVADDYVKKLGQHKGLIEVLWIGARYGATSADPRTLTIIGRTA